MKVGFISLGCAKNLVDSENIIALFDDPFFEYEYDLKQCETILINTCGFILSAKEEAIDTILEIASYKQDKLKKLIVTGCFVQRYYEECLEEFPEVDLFVPIRDYDRLPQLLSQLFNHHFINTYGKNRKLVNNSYTAYLRISDGCDNRCAYCAIPLIRGNCRSFSIEDNVEEAKRLLEMGVKELNVVAQDTTYYGHDLYGRFALKDLIKELDQLDFRWIRILYMYPDEIEEDLLIEMSRCRRVLPYFDIPIQYGNDTILKLMNRRGSVELIKEKIALIRKYFPNAVIRTTLIVGFPHETEETFNDTLKLVKEIRFDSLGAFTFSPEEDTRAYEMDEQVDEELKNERYEKLMLEQQQIIEEKNQEKIGKTYTTLIERYESLFDRYIGRTYMSAPDGIDGVVYIKTDQELQIGSFYPITITGYKDYDLIGSVAENEETVL
ncbi:MAG: 30S ribosomal protein S12 methylthiotransferase RimO [Erysipelotrichaceae bacterium]|nr:30S ribosomal protein S12 methylthiotransferase RimO [Erysipelotrichaceae bacterium]